MRYVVWVVIEQLCAEPDGQSRLVLILVSGYASRPKNNVDFAAHWDSTSSGVSKYITSIACERGQALRARRPACCGQQLFLLPPTLPTRGSRETMAALDTPLERGQALAIEGEYEAALEALTEATTEDASNAKAWEATAQVLLAASDDSDERSAAKLW